ncbi:MAG: hypothetical protein QXF36_06715 [Candidatus Caldarchaeum sp.]
MVNINIKLLPYGTLARELVLSALSPLAFTASLGGTTLHIYEDEAVVCGPIDSLAQVFQNAQQLLLNKNKLPAINPHYNDRQVMAKIKGKLNLQVNDTYRDYVDALCSWAINDLQTNPDKWLESLDKINYSTKTITLGEPKSAFSGFQPLKIEKYKYGKRFGDFRAQMDIKMDERWVALVLAGFGVCYSGFADGEIILSTIPEKVIMKAAVDFNWLNYVQQLTQSMGNFTVFQALMMLPYTVRATPELPHAYSLLLALELARIKPAHLSIREAPPYVFYRIIYQRGQSFSLLERLSIDYSFLAPFVEKLSIPVNDNLRDFLRCTIIQARRQNNYCSNRYGDASLCDRLSRALYAAAAKVKPADETIYLLARSSPENSPFRRTDVLREIYNALS